MTALANTAALAMSECFYGARAALQNADVVVTNHALLCLDPGCRGHILPPADVVVVDEAHKLPDTCAAPVLRNHHCRRCSARSRSRRVRRNRRHGRCAGRADRAGAQHGLATNNTDDSQVQIHHDENLDGAAALALHLLALADDIFPEDELPSDPDEKAGQTGDPDAPHGRRVAMMAGPRKTAMYAGLSRAAMATLPTV